MKATDTVLFEVRAERTRQVEELRYDAEHDDTHGVLGMLDLVNAYAEDAYATGLVPERADVLRIQLVRLAALTVATIETLDRRDSFDMAPDEAEAIGACDDCGGSGDCPSCEGNGTCRGCGGSGSQEGGGDGRET